MRKSKKKRFGKAFILEAAFNNNLAFFELFIEHGGDINFLKKFF